MKPLLLVLLALTLTTVSCGGKDKGGSSSSGQFTSSLSTQEGYINLNNQQAPIEVGGTSYAVPNQQVAQMINQAIYQSGLQPQNINGVMKYRARFTGMIYNPYANQTTSGYGYNGYYNPYQNMQGTLQITAVQVY
ncbi:hypothetical protein ACJVC5_04165 [Peredibacter sp. HCB2-198]|uniref:hypothetical protein n=1 Tax=Peredibacter sp. HCB2-198 TaxID=3383025 RepID=UPI0038B5D92D